MTLPRHYPIPCILIAAFAVRLVLLLAHDGYAGVDMGAYILGLNQLLGTDTSRLTGPGLPRPPLAPGLLLWPFLALGPDIGGKLFIAVASMLPPLATWLVASRLTPRFAWVAVLGVTLDWWLVELAIAGAVPLIGFSLILVAMWGVMESHRWRGRIAIAAAIPLLAHASMTAAGIAAIVLPVFAVAWWWKAVDKKLGFRAVFIPVAIGLLLSLTALPWYLPQIPGSENVAYQGGPLWYLAPVWDAVWWQVLLMSPVVAFMLFGKGQHPGVQSDGIVVLALLPLMVAWSYDEALMNVYYRSRYFADILFWLGVAVMVARFWGDIWRNSTTRVTFGTLWAGYAAAYLIVFGVSYPQMRTISPDTLGAIERIEAAPAGTVTNAGALSFWLAALTGEYSVYVQVSEPPARFTADYETLRCVLGWRDGCDPVAEAAALGIGYVLVDERIYEIGWRLPPIWGAPPDPWARLDALPWLELVYERGQVRLWKIHNP